MRTCLAVRAAEYFPALRGSLHPALVVSEAGRSVADFTSAILFDFTTKIVDDFEECTAGLGHMVMVCQQRFDEGVVGGLGSYPRHKKINL